MSASSERELYEAWVELLSWMREYAQAKGVRFEKEADFPDFIYRMERPYDLPTTIMTASSPTGLGNPSSSPTSPRGTPSSSASASAFPGPTSTFTPTTSRERAWSRGRSPHQGALLRPGGPGAGGFGLRLTLKRLPEGQDHPVEEGKGLRGGKKPFPQDLEEAFLGELHRPPLEEGEEGEPRPLLHGPHVHPFPEP